MPVSQKEEKRKVLRELKICCVCSLGIISLSFNFSSGLNVKVQVCRSIQTQICEVLINEDMQVPV